MKSMLLNERVWRCVALTCVLAHGSLGARD